MCAIKINVCLQYIFIMVLSVFMTPVAEATLKPADRAKLLKAKGYLTDTSEQIIEATKSESYFVRHIALELLTDRIGKKAIPTLKDALNDPWIEVRWRAAHCLGTLGDNSGLERMRQDLREFAPDNGAPVSPEPNVTGIEKIREQESARNLRLYNALTAAKVLAELGDHSGYELATRMALEGPRRWQRYEAIYTLVEIAKTDRATLRAKGLNPVFILSAVAESEKDKHVIYLLTNQVRKNLNDDIAILQILETAKNSPNLSEKDRRVVQLHLDAVKDKGKNS